ncbi:F-box domain-containing protein [Pleurotus pulmonarius]
MIHDLPQEVLEDILIHCDPCDVAAVSQTCRRFRDLIYFSDDNHLWRALYLSQPLDDPRICVDQAGRPVGRSGNFDWKFELHAITRARSVLNDPKLLREGEIVITLRTLLKLTINNRPISPSFSNYDDISQNLLWVAAHLRKHDDYFLGYPLRSDLDVTSEEIQLRSRLHAYFGVTHDDVKRSALSASRAYVYSLRNYSNDNLYGPYLKGERRKVNWVHVQAIHHIFALHIVNLEEGDTFEYAILPMSMPHIQPILEDISDLEGETDWAQVEGDWICSFCFCDHRDLLAFNQANLQTEETNPLDPAFFESQTFREVFRSMAVKLKVVKIVPSVGGQRPTIHFTGGMGDPTTGSMTGFVEMTSEANVRWHFVSGEAGNSIWCSEGIQVGGVRSLYGVLGTWTTIFHDFDDPVGPFWLRRLVGR